MNCNALHHVEMCVGNGKKIVSYFTESLGFSLRAWRDTTLSQQWVLGSHKSIFLVTERKNGQLSSSTKVLPPFSQFCCPDQTSHRVDSVFNVALEVKDLDYITNKMRGLGAKLFQPVTEIKDNHGIVRFSVVGSCCGNIIHTLLDKSKYTGPFLPTFHSIESQQTFKEMITHIDHITYVCHPGKSSEIIQWYQDCLGMKRFKVNANEDLNEGLVIKDGVGMRLRVMDYWSCAETGVYHPR